MSDPGIRGARALRARRAAAQLLSGSEASSPEEVVTRLLAVQAQDFRAARLVPAFDAYLLGSKDRSFALPSEHARRIHPGGGVLRPAILVEGGVAGTWTVRRRAGRIDVTLDPFAPLAPEAETALAADAADVVRFETA